ncbi:MULTISPECIES: hypothetical protein [unclassified Streptomyces]|uniref:hypothetical protein n=1 Tax=unclassified Streptomyces TaxID=2593676 RepID=UPI0036E72098
MPSDRLIGLLLPLAFLVAFVGIPVAFWWERRRPSSYTRSPEYLAWGERSSSWQESYDDVVLDAEEAAHEAALRAVDVKAEVEVAEAALVEAARRNVLYRP